MSILFVVVLGITTGVLMIFNSKEKEEVQKEDVLGVNTLDLASVPYVTSVAPVDAYVGKEYVYSVKYSDQDSKSTDISIELINAPSWLTVNGLNVVGTPVIGSEGTYKVSVRISDGTNSSVQDFYILVQSNEE